MGVPFELDGARVILYTNNNENNNFGYIHCGEQKEVVTGLAITKYDNDESYYLFSCDLEWSVIGDTLHSTLEEAKECAKISHNANDGIWHVAN